MEGVVVVQWSVFFSAGAQMKPCCGEYLLTESQWDGFPFLLTGPDLINQRMKTM